MSPYFGRSYPVRSRVDESKIVGGPDEILDPGQKYVDTRREEGSRGRWNEEWHAGAWSRHPLPVLWGTRPTRSSPPRPRHLRLPTASARLLGTCQAVIGFVASHGRLTSPRLEGVSWVPEISDLRACGTSNQRLTSTSKPNRQILPSPSGINRLHLFSCLSSQRSFSRPLFPRS